MSCPLGLATKGQMIMNQKIARVQLPNGAHVTMWRMGDMLYDTYTSIDGYTTDVTATRIYRRDRSKSLRELALAMWESPESVTVR